MASDAPERATLSRRIERAAVGCATGGLGVIGLLAAVAFGTYVFLRTERGNEFLRERVEGALEGLTPYGDVEIGRLRTDLWNDLALYDVRVLDERGETLAFVERALLDLSLGVLTRKIIRAPRARLDGVYLDIELRDDGVLNLARVFGQTEVDPSEEEWQGLPVLLDVPDLVVNGAHVIYRDPDGEQLRAVGLDLHAGLYGKETIELRDLELSGLLAAPGPTALRVEGSAAWNADGFAFTDVLVDLPRSRLALDGTIGDTYDATVAVHQVDFPTIDPLIGEPGLTGTYRGDIRVTGPTDTPRFVGTLTGVGATFGTADLDVTVHGEEDPVRVAGDVRAGGFHLHHLVPEVDEPVILNGSASFWLLADDYPEGFFLDVRYDGGRQEAYGQTVESLSGRFTIEEGILTIEGAHARGIVGEVDVAGRIDLEGGDMRFDVEGTAEPGYLADFGIEGLGTTGYVDVTVTGNFERIDTQPIRARGTATWAPFAYEADVAFDRAVAVFDASVRPDEVVTGVADVTATSGVAYGVAVGAAHAPDARFVVPLDGGASVFEGSVAATRLVMPDTFAVSRARGVWNVTAPPDADLVLRTRLELGPHDVLGFPGTAGRLVARLAGDDVDYDLVLRQDARDMIVSDGSWDLGTNEVVMDSLVLSPTPRATWTSRRAVRFRLTDSGVADADVSLASELGAIDLQGTIGTRGELDAHVLVTDLQLDTFAELFPDRASGLAGELDLAARLTGRGADPIVEAAIELEGLWVEDTVRWLDVRGRVTADGAVVRPDLRIGVAGEALAIVAGEVPVSLDLADPRLATGRPVDLSVALRPGSLERLEWVSPALEPGSLPTGDFSAVLRATGPVEDPDLRFAGVAEIDVRNWTEPARFEFDLTRDATDLAFWADVREGFQQAGTVRGSGVTRVDEVFAWALEGAPRPDLEDPALWLDQMLVDGVLLGLPAASVAAAADADVVVSGDIVGGFTVTGSPYTPQIEASLSWLDGSIGELELELAYAQVTPLPDAYDVELVLDFVEEGGLTLDGTIPVRVDFREEIASWTAGALDLDVSGGLPLSLATALDPAVRDAEGVLQIDGHVGGTFADPAPELVARVEDGSLVHDRVGLRFYDIDGDLIADNRQILVPRLTMNTEPVRRNVFGGGLGAVGETDPSLVVASGSARLEEWAPTAVDARVQLLNDAWVVATPEAQLRMEGEVLVSGSWPALVITGDLELERGNAVIDTASFLTAAPLELDEEIELVRPGVELVDPDVEGEEDDEAVYQDFDVAIAFDLNRNLSLDMTIPWIEELGTFGATVTQADISARMGGQLDITLSAGKPAFVGEIEVIEGEAQVVRSRFDTLEGSLVYYGSEPDNPNLDLYATMDLPEGELTMTIQGTAEEPEIGFVSEAYPDETEQLAILITGRAPEDLGGNQAEAAAQTLAGALLNTLFSGQALSNITIDPEGAVEVGVPLGSDVFATTRLFPAADIDENRIEAALEISLGSQFVLSGGAGDRTGWADIFWEFRF